MQENVAARVALLEEHGPALGRPTVDHVKASAFHNVKELRCSSDGALRVLFTFDPRREAVLLLGGDKAGNWTALETPLASVSAGQRRVPACGARGGSRTPTPEGTRT